MRLKELLKSLAESSPKSPDTDFEVKGITCNSKAVKDNFIFVAVKGTKDDGHEFIGEAIEGGAKAIITQCQVSSIKYQDKINFIKVPDTRRALAGLAAEFYGNPSLKIKVVGVTGTNGKTTITYLIESLLKEAGSAPAVIGTVNYRFKDKIYPSKNTTPSAVEIQSFLAQMLNEGIDYLAMEVSSHALCQDRTEGINFHSAVFTNFTQDHLDYHKTLENYFQAKAKLFRQISPSAFAVINNDDSYAPRLKRLTKAGLITYAIKNNADVSARQIKFDIRHTEFLLVTPKDKLTLKTSLIGIHNVYNILAASAWAFKAGLDLGVVGRALERFNFVPGRLEMVNQKGSFFVFVDYAHTEDALSNVISSLRHIARKKIIVVFGCGGERDKKKRPRMARVVSELADYAVITNDNPRSEDPGKIINDIKKGFKGNSYCIIPQRRQAIRKSLSLAGSGDIVLVAGKGHEDYQIIGEKVLAFSDREVIQECLKSMKL